METAPSPRFRRLRLTPDHVVPALLALEGLLLVAERFGWFTFDRHKGYPPLLAIAAVGAVFVLMLLCFLVALVFRRPFQFSLRSLLLLVVVVAIPCSWLSVEMKAARRQREAVEAIQKAGGWVSYDYGAAPSGTAPQPPWSSRLPVFDLLANVSLVSIHGAEVTDADMERLKELTRLQELNVSSTKISNAGMVQLEGLTKLKVLWLGGTKVSDAGLEHLKGLNQLKTLDLSRTKVSAAGVRELKKALPKTNIMTN